MRGPRWVRWPALGSAAAFAVAGFLFATSAETARGTDLRPASREDLAEVIRDQEGRVARQAEAVREQRAELEELSGGIVAGSAPALPDSLEQVAGTGAVSGPAVRVTLDDSPLDLGDPALPPDTRPDDLVVHQQDLQAVVNALWAGGAEAVQLMDQRIVATSAVRCVGPVLVLQGRVYSPPYTVTAVGPVDGMLAALDRSDGVLRYRDWVDLVGLRYDAEDAGEVRLPAFEGPLDLQHARPA